MVRRNIKDNSEVDLKEFPFINESQEMYSDYYRVESSLDAATIRSILELNERSVRLDSNSPIVEYQTNSYAGSIVWYSIHS